MQNSAQEFCSFCLKSRNEVDIIDTTKNSLLIDNKCYEFSYIFNDLLQFTSSDECICEMCKDLMVSFYLFKRNIKFPHNHIFRMLIKNQIEEYLNTFVDNIEDIKVIRTVNAITLEIQQNEIKIENKPDISEEVEEQEYEENATTEEMGYETLINYHCPKCETIEPTENDSEIHEFLRHSTFGAQLEVEIENSKVYSESTDIEDTFYVCGFCTSHLESFDLLLLHLLNVHNPEVLFQINEALNIPSHLIEFPTINGYLNYIKECLHHDNKMTNSVDYELKKYFYEVYGEMDEMSNASEKDMQEQEIEISEMNGAITEYDDNKIKKDKQEKLTEDLSLNDKEWVRNQITKSKRYVNTETGEKRVVYQCDLSDSCRHISNSAPGLRYHLINKHLKHRKEFEDRKRRDSNELIETYPYITKNSSKNCCNDCGLKFKDQRAYQLHERCHELFKTVANHSDSIFPSCNTCNQKFLNEDLLQHHLNKHDKNENLSEAIETEIGAIRQQGKIFTNFIRSDGETGLTDYTWKCGHCDSKNFSKEENCNLHLLLVHTVSFVCPIDKMEFKGFKSVSLFIHHLRNKHSELFPNLSFNCTFCQREFPTIYDKLNHMKNCDRKNLQCDHCGKRFWKKGDLLTHLKYVTGEVQFKCSVCTKKCISASDLSIHLRSHSKIKPYKCSLCTKSFRTLAARAAHVDAHNANLMFSCEICKKSFKQRQLYRRHMKAHESKGDISR
ncbi:unnamed protein product [Chironomus riparius]|uniref:C2H2-type domain-containing protein n=1 Tax=Chironomus riparius TaxID=315576 RepID=A0A9N9S1P5_9DIPT|nr:unnamed protein product [Chironomus riparius]